MSGVMCKGDMWLGTGCGRCGRCDAQSRAMTVAFGSITELERISRAFAIDAALEILRVVDNIDAARTLIERLKQECGK